MYSCVSNKPKVKHHITSARTSIHTHDLSIFYEAKQACLKREEEKWLFCVCVGLYEGSPTFLESVSCLSLLCFVFRSQGFSLSSLPFPYNFSEFSLMMMESLQLTHILATGSNPFQFAFKSHQFNLNNFNG